MLLIGRTAQIADSLIKPSCVGALQINEFVTQAD